MPLSQNFSREIKVAAAGLEPEAISALLETIARETLAEAQAADEFPASYITSVNGVVGAREESVTPPGPIVYTAVWWPQILAYGLAFAQARSPSKSGRYRNSWFVLANGEKVEEVEYDSIPLLSECIITNNQPYSRKIEVGAQKVNLPPGVVEDLVSALRRQFGTLVTVRRRFIDLPEGLLPASEKKGSDTSKPHAHITYPSAVIELNI